MNSQPCIYISNIWVLNGGYVGTHFISIEKSAQYSKSFRRQYIAFPFLYKLMIQSLFKHFMKIITSMYRVNPGISKTIHT